MTDKLVGVLAMQGAYAKQRESLARCGAATIEVRTLGDLQRCERLVLPGGESSTMYRLLQQAGLWRALCERAVAGMPIFGTCAGMILLSRRVAGIGQSGAWQSAEEQPCLGLIDLEVQRNAYGRQIASFSADLDLRTQQPENPDFAALIQAQSSSSANGQSQPLIYGAGGVDGATKATEELPKLPLIFIRAPQAVSWGPSVQVLLRYSWGPSSQANQAICLQQGKVLVCSFHPELSDSLLLHQYFLSL